MTTPNRPPLWEVIDEAITEAGDDVLSNVASSAAILALRDWLVPEESELPGYLKGSELHISQIQRQRLRALLTAEAERAERGDA